MTKTDKEKTAAISKIIIGIILFTAVALFINGDRFLSLLSTSKKSPESNDKNFAKIDLNDLEQGCPSKDCIPSIDNPKFETATEADKWLRVDDLVFGINYKGIKRAYPQRILNWHEIVNDEIKGDPILITFCPLCASVLAFERKVNGNPAEFGVSGRLINSNLVMYDRLEDNLWQQVTGEAIVGPAAKRGEKLKKISFSAVSWAEWKRNHPDTQVLSRDTGHTRDYDLYPYGTYEQDNQIYFGVKNTDQRLPLKEIIYGFDIDGKYKAYTLSILRQEKIIQDTIGSIQVKVEYKKDGEVLLTVSDNQKTYVPLRTFWFAWAAFHPGTELFK